jgi:predicted CoA-binding protein
LLGFRWFDMKKQMPIVAVLGASPKPERYSNQAVRLLLEKGYRVIPIHPAIPKIEGLPVATSLSDITEHIDTLTIYVSSAISTPLKHDIISLNPSRVIFNPGSENPELNTSLQAAGIHTETACTLVLMNTRQF